MPIVVCIIEDDEPTRKILADWIDQASEFRLAGHWCAAEAALVALPSLRPDVVLMDVQLPAMSGVEAVRILKPLMPATQFVMLTVYRDADRLYAALEAGASGYLLKQTSREELLAALEDVHAGGSPMSTVIARKVVQFFNEAAPGNPSGPELSAREKEALDLLSRGYYLKEAAEKLGLRMGTLKTYVRRMYEKLQVHSRSQAVAKYAQMTPRRGSGSAAEPRKTSPTTK